MPSLPRECGGNRWPWSNGAIILLNVAMMFATIANARLVPPLEMDVHRLTLWRFVSYAFVHESWPHLLFNMIALYVLGNPINQRFGQIGYLAFYLAGAIAAAIGFLMVGGEAMIGASGAVGAVIGAYLALLPRSNIRIFIGVGTLQVRSMYLLIIFFLYNVLMSVASRLGAQPVAYEAHVAGMLFGFIVCLGLLLLKLLPRQPQDVLTVMGDFTR